MKECVRCGNCCLTAPCPFGLIGIGHSCAYLVGEENGTFACGIYNEIKDKPGCDIAPAFGAGCCQSLFNTRRDKIVAANIHRDE